MGPTFVWVINVIYEGSLIVLTMYLLYIVGVGIIPVPGVLQHKGYEM